MQPGEIHSIKRAQDSLVQACAVISIGVSDIGVATTGNKNAVFVMLVDLIMLTSQSLKCLDLKI